MTMRFKLLTNRLIGTLVKTVAGYVSKPQRNRLSITGALGLLLLMVAGVQNAAAQTFDPSLLEDLRRKSMSGTPRTITSPVDRGREMTLSEQARQELILRQKKRYQKPSRLEEDYRNRVDQEELSQFGYSLFENLPYEREVITGTVSDNYILGVGDELVITFQGSKTETLVIKVDREGRVTLPEIRPITVVGRTLGDFKKTLSEQVAETLIGTEAYVSLSSFRMISVIVAGEVFDPGIVRTTSLSSALEVLMMAGGVKKSGSLRNIKILRGNDVFKVDLYDLLLGHGAGSVPLLDGDRIVVPVVGPTVAVTGDVVRPGIYELKNPAGISVDNALKLAGGTIRPTGYSFSHVRLDAEGKQAFSKVSSKDLLKGSEALIATMRENSQTGKIELVGHVKIPGVRSLATASTIRELVGRVENLDDDPYMLFGVIERVDGKTRNRKLIEFSPEKIFFGGQDIPLQDQDRIVFFGRDDIAYLTSQEVREVIMSGEYLVKKTLDNRTLNKNYCAPLDNLARIIKDTQSERFATAVRAVFVRKETEEERIRDREELAGEDLDKLREDMERRALLSRQQKEASFSPRPANVEVDTEDGEASRKMQLTFCPAIYSEVEYLLPFTLEYVVSVDGAVRQPGVYPITPETSVASLLSVSGGTSHDANLARIEVANFENGGGAAHRIMNWEYVDAMSASLENVTLNPGGSVRIGSVHTNFEPGAVLLSGEFKQPGVYTIRKGEKLSELILRAGGFTEQAYPYGAIFTRKRVKELQEAELRRTAERLRSAMVSASVKKSVEADSLMAARQLTEQVASTEMMGRVVIEADPVKLALDPAKDIVLEAGDALFVPKRPNFIVAIGDVLNPGALQFVPGKTVKEYLEEVGGFSRSADEDRVFVVYPNGVARPVQLSSWGGDRNLSLPPGSAVVVPTDLSPYDSLTLIKEIGSIVQSLAVSAASLAVIFTN